MEGDNEDAIDPEKLKEQIWFFSVSPDSIADIQDISNLLEEMIDDLTELFPHVGLVSLSIVLLTSSISKMLEVHGVESGMLLIENVLKDFREKNG